VSCSVEEARFHAADATRGPIGVDDSPLSIKEEDAIVKVFEQVMEVGA
jgi:hypothetical protein